MELDLHFTDRIWFKYHYGLSVKQIGRDPGLCASAILFWGFICSWEWTNRSANTFQPICGVWLWPPVLCAVPLRTEDHHNLGTLCIIDKNPRHFDEKDKQIQEKLGKLVMDEMQKRLRLRNFLSFAYNWDKNFQKWMFRIWAGRHINRSLFICGLVWSYCYY